MKSAAGLEVVVGDLHLVCELLATEDQTDLLDLDTFLLLEGLLDLQDRVVTLEIIRLLSTCEGLNEKLHILIFLIIIKSQLNNLFKF